MSTEVWTITDMPDKIAPQSWTPDQVMSGIYVAEGCIGVIGNAFVILVIFTHTAMRKQLTNFLIINQSLIDFTSSVVLICNVLTVDRGQIMTGVSGILLCKLWYSTYLLWSSTVSSTFNLLAIALERYFCIVHPIMYKTTVTISAIKKVCCAVWLVGFGLEVLITLLPAGIDENGRCNTHHFWPSEDVQKGAGVGTIVVCFIIPLMIMIFTYGKMTMVLKSRIKTVDPEMEQQAGHAKDQTMARASKNIFKTLIIVTVCFTICWMPNQIIFLYYNLGYALTFTTWYYHLTIFLVYLNCCCNPIIYAAQYEQFQIGIAKLKSRVIGRINSASSTAATTDTSNN